MRCKLYRGPFHGQVRDFNPVELEKGYVEMSMQLPRNRNWIDTCGYVPTFKTVRYEIRMMGGTIGTRSFYGPAVHPDGSLFLEYVGPKRGKK